MRPGRAEYPKPERENNTAGGDSDAHQEENAPDNTQTCPESRVFMGMVSVCDIHQNFSRKVLVFLSTHGCGGKVTHGRTSLFP